MSLDDRSERKMLGVHLDLVKVVRAAADVYAVGEQQIIVTEGLRTAQRQAELLKIGASQTMFSRHLTGHAVDLAVKLRGEVRWDWPLYTRLGSIMKDCAISLGVPIVWGGDWESLKDGPHFELDKRFYPVQSYTA